jgi:ATP-dependent helicase HrpA
VDPGKLPVYQQKERILAALAEQQVIVVQSPTGSGKTTQIPQILLDAGYARSKMIGVTQPRRIAAVSVAGFIARQRGVAIPATVGYKMRFEDRTDASTRIKIMTDGILLQEIKADYSLSRYGVIMVDEAHERSLNIDFTLGLLKKVLEDRPEFKVIVSSATINAEVFAEYFDECPVVTIESSMFPVEMHYEPPDPESGPEGLLDKIAEIVQRIVSSDPRSGDILIFLPGEGTIKDCLALLESLPVSRRLEVLPLYSRLSSEEQERVFLDYPGKVKVIAATNIAETSVTIDGVTTVIDTGLAKVNFYNHQNFTSSLIEVPISKASANQRRGRAGRTRPGVCYRLYSRKDYEARPLFSTEEIHRTDLSEVVLRMAELGIRDFERFEFVSPPSRTGILSAIETLKLLDALDENRELTSIGRQMLAFPILPKFSRILVEAIRRYPSVLEEALVAVSFLSSRTPFILPPGEELEARKAHHSFRDPQGDFVSYLKVFEAFRSSRNPERFCQRNYLDPRTVGEIVNIKTQLEEILAEQGIPVGSGGPVADYLCAIARGLIQFVCVATGRGSYKSLTAGRIQIHPGSVMFHENPRYIVAGEIVRTRRMYAHSVSPLRREWLERISPDLLAGLSGGERRARRERPEHGELAEAPARKRDFTNNIKIGREVFQVSVEKGGRKTAVLPWERIRPLAEGMDRDLAAGYQKLRGKVVYDGFELLSGMRLSTILRLVPLLEPERGILDRPDEQLFGEAPPGFAERLADLLRPCRLKKRARKLGFLALFTDGQGSYWFKGTRNYLSALRESLYSLESLADAPAGKMPHAEQINAVYRALSRRLEQL